MFREISFSLGPCVNEFTIQLPDFSIESVRNLVKLSNLDWTEHHAWSVEDLELFQHLGIVVSVKLKDSPDPDIVIDEVIEDDPDPAVPAIQVPRIPKQKCKNVRAANLLKPVSVKNNNSRKRKRKSADAKRVICRNVNMKQTYDGLIKKCQVMLKNEKFTNIDSTPSVSTLSMENFIEREKTGQTKNVPKTPVIMVENPLYDNRMETNQYSVSKSLKINTKTDGFESEEEEKNYVIEEILSIIKTTDIKNNEQENYIKRKNVLKKEENDDEKEVEQRNEVDGDEEEDEEEDEEDDEEDDEEEYHQIQKTLILEQDFSDDEGSDVEDYLDNTALHNERDTLLKELGLSDDESS